MLKQAEQRSRRVAKDKQLFPLFLHRNVDCRHGPGNTLLFCRTHNPRVADVAAAFTAEFCQQRFIDPGKRHRGIGINHARTAKRRTKLLQHITGKPQNVQPVEICRRVNNPLDNGFM